MNNKIVVNDGSTALNIISWLFGIVAIFIGVVNAFWGNDPGFGVFVLLLAAIYFLPVNTILKRTTAFTIPWIRIIRVLLGIFILWAALGVGELADKIELMMNNL